MIDTAAVKIQKKSVAVWWLGQGGFLFKTSSGYLVAVDPYLSGSVNLPRIVPVPVAPSELKADLLFCTHDHEDHADRATLSHVKDITNFAGPGSVCRIYMACGIDKTKTISIDRGESKQIGPVKVTSVFARHTGDSVGVVLDLEGVTVYVSGDTEYDDKLKEVQAYRPDLMFICINGKWGNMSYADAVRLCGEVKPQMVIPMHYGMFAENTVDPQMFLDELKKTCCNGAVRVLEIGEPFVFPVA